MYKQKRASEEKTDNHFQSLAIFSSLRQFLIKRFSSKIQQNEHRLHQPKRWTKKVFFAYMPLIFLHKLVHNYQSRHRNKYCPFSSTRIQHISSSSLQKYWQPDEQKHYDCTILRWLSVEKIRGEEDQRQRIPKVWILNWFRWSETLQRQMASSIFSIH